MARIQSQDPQDPQYYPKSRGALRDLYGAPRTKQGISPADGTPSARLARERGFVDDTPSGREREMRKRGTDDREIEREQNSYWREIFKAPIPQQPTPMARMAPIPVAPPPLDIMGQIKQARDWGAVNGTFQTPYGTAGFDLRPQTPPDETALTQQLADIPLPKSFYGAQSQRPSILSGASKWLK